MKTPPFPKNLPGFSLIELALVLIVIGILAGAIFKGQDILESAKIRSVLNDVDRIRTAVTLYRDTYGQWPGNDDAAKQRFGQEIVNGQGTGIISQEEANQFWVHLAKADHLSEGKAPSSKMGGKFSVEGDLVLRKNFLILSGEGKSGILTPKQAAAIKAKAGEATPSEGLIHVTEGVGSVPGSCVQGDAYHLATKSPTCILKVELH